MKQLEIRQLRTLYVYEFRKIVSRRIVWIIGAIMLLCAAMSFADLLSTSYSYRENDEEINATGYEMMKLRREGARKLSGREIDDSLLQEIQDDTQGAVNGGDTGMGEEALWNRLRDKQKYIPIYLWALVIMGDTERVETTDAAGLYSERENLISQNRSGQMLTQKELDYWKKNDAGIKVPFTYEYMEGWGSLWDQVSIINCMLLLLLTVSLSDVFSAEHLRKMDAMILCSRHGRKELYIAKILAGITFGAAAALLLSGTALISDLAVYGADGFGGALQIEYPLSSRKISIGGAALFLVFLVMVISVMYSTSVMFLSEWLKKSVGVMAVPVGIMIFTLFIDIPCRFGIISRIYKLLPTNLLVAGTLWDDRLFSVFGKYMTNFQIAPAVYLLFSMLLLLTGKRLWKQCEVGA